MCSPGTFMCLSLFQLQAFVNQKKGRRFFACGLFSSVLCLNYKPSAQAGAATCQRQAQAFWFMQSFMCSNIIYAHSSDVNRPAGPW